MIPTKINIGCGYDKRPDYLNIDSDSACSPDIVIIDNDLSGLPLGYFEEAIALDVLEHIPRAHMMNALYDWSRLIRLNGELFVETSYIFGILDVMRRADDFETMHNWKRCLFGNQVHPGDWHHNGFTIPTLTTYMRAVGFDIVQINIRQEWLIQVWGIKTEDWNDLRGLDHRDFLETGFPRLIGRAPEEWRTKNFTAPNSVEREAEIKALLTSEERLYWLGNASFPIDSVTPMSQQSKTMLAEAASSASRRQHKVRFIPDAL
jgi:hypothetical protein